MYTPKFKPDDIILTGKRVRLVNGITYIANQPCYVFGNVHGFCERVDKTSRLSGCGINIDKSDNDHLEWLYWRFINVHNENPNVDYMKRFNKILEKNKAAK